MVLDFHAADAYARLRYLNDPRAAMNLPPESINIASSLMAQAALEDDAVIKSHIENGGQWAVLAPSFMRFRDRARRLEIRVDGTGKSREFFMINDYHQLAGMDKKRIKVLVIDGALPDKHREIEYATACRFEIVTEYTT